MELSFSNLKSDLHTKSLLYELGKSGKGVPASNSPRILENWFFFIEISVLSLGEAKEN